MIAAAGDLSGLKSRQQRAARTDRHAYARRARPLGPTIRHGVVKATDLGDLTAFLLRTGTRSHEARSARREDIDFDRRVWTIPPENAKAGRKHEVPLSPGAWKQGS